MSSAHSGDDVTTFYLRRPGLSLLLLAAAWGAALTLSRLIGVPESSWAKVVASVLAIGFLALVGATFLYVLTVLGATRGYWEEVEQPRELERERRLREWWEREEEKRRQS